MFLPAANRRLLLTCASVVFPPHTLIILFLRIPIFIHTELFKTSYNVFEKYTVKSTCKVYVSTIIY